MIKSLQFTAHGLQIRKILLCICIVVSGQLLTVSAQDIHFSQFNFSPLNQNPANTNLFDGDYRFVGNYKNQWPTVPVQYNTFSASVDMNFVTLKNNDRIGGGFLFYFDRAGDSRFTSFHAALSASYTKALDKNGNHSLTGGMQFGLVNRSFDYSKLTFDNQWTGDFFNPNLPVDEQFTRTRFNFFDLGAGLAYRWKKTDRTNVVVGFGAAHLNQPKQSLYNDNSIKLNPRFTVHSRGQVQVSDKIDIVPEFMFQIQSVKYEVDLGAHLKYYIPLKKAHRLALNLGAYSRMADAGWLLAGFDYDQLQVNLSYDVNFSRLTSASRYNGGFEASVIYILARVKKINKPGAICPAFL
ncbi:MAG: PorP/SprF family type IX secretion system membrane protein [Bacteroidetes bacterium]|nr:PorP/SprF family type IX secretion system membrane protein [Bacteroidota bacterium]